MKVCDICKQIIESHQGYHQTGTRIVHSACEAGGKPRPSSGMPPKKKTKSDLIDEAVERLRNG